MMNNSTVIVITLERTIPFHRQQVLHIRPMCFVQLDSHDLEERLLEKASGFFKIAVWDVMALRAHPRPSLPP